jgi:hypothetical protein
MRGKIMVGTLLVALAGFAVPAAAGHWGGHVWFGWGLGWGWPWWGAPGWYQPVPVEMVHADLAAVSTNVEPEHARVYLNGELIGVADDFDGTPSYLYLKPGHYTLEFRLGGYRTETTEIDAKPGQHYPVDLKLSRVPGEKVTPWYERPRGLPVARVFGPKPGATPEADRPGPDTSLRPELRQPGQEATAGKAAIRGAALDLQITPPDAAVYIDGQLVGSAAELARLERGLAVAGGRHRVEVVAPNHESKVVAVDVKEGERQQVVVQLEEGAGQTGRKDL